MRKIDFCLILTFDKIIMLFSEPNSITKLSPRASSEGSASFEDSGHVSGASTQENTPEHRRTDSLQSQTSMGSSRLSTVTDVSLNI
jgi:hypothetical protein